MNQRPSHSRADQLLVAAIFAAGGLALLCWFVLFAQPTERTHQKLFQKNYSDQPLVDRLTPESVRERIDQIAKASQPPGERQVGRLSGSPGFYRTEALIEKTFRDNGLEVLTQEFEVVVPVTETCEILGADGRPLPGVTLYPFEPSGILPVSLPSAGIKGRLVEAETTKLSCLDGHDPGTSIVLTSVDAAGGWMLLAGAGVPAVIVREDESLQALRASPDDPAPWTQVTKTDDLPYPRFLARGPIEKYAGQEITLRCVVKWQSKKVRNVLGVLRGQASAREALTLTAFYDSNSVVPEIAPGAEQSLSLAALLEYVHAFAAYRGQLDRDVIFVATAGHAQGLAGVSRLMEAIETFTQERADYRTLESQRTDELKKLDYAKKAADLWSSLPSGPRLTAEAFRAKWFQDEAFQEWFETALQVVTGEINLTRKEEALERKLSYIRAGKPTFRAGFDAKHATDEERRRPENTHPLLRDYIAAQTRENVSANLMSLPVWELVTRPEYAEWNYARAGAGYFERLRRDEEQKVKELEDSIQVQKRFASYDRTLTVNLELYSGGSQRRNGLALLVGLPTPGTVVEPQVTELADCFRANTPSADGKFSIPLLQWGPRDAAGSKEHPNSVSAAYTELESEAWFRCGRLAFTFVNSDFFSPKICTPEDDWHGLSTDAVEQLVPVLGRSLLAVAHGRVPFKSIKPDKTRNIFTVTGTVYGSAGAESVLPSHPMSVHTFVRAYASELRAVSDRESRGVHLFPMLEADPTGHFEKKICFDLAKWGKPMVTDAVRFDDDGRVLYINDLSATSQSIYNSEKFPSSEAAANGSSAPRPVNLSMFRCAIVDLYHMVNPQTLSPFKGLNFLSQTGLGLPAHHHLRAYASFLDPDFDFYVGLLDGAADNPEFLTYRSFLLNDRALGPITKDEPDLFGDGYLAADAGTLVMPDFDAAASMLRTSEKRLRLLQQYGMADEQMLGFQKESQEWLADATQKLDQKDISEALNAASASLAYAINNYPVIRSRISQAVIGILWYLGLLVPFVLFMEKLIFGFTDIRKQLLASGVIFLLVFAVLRVFHPAFEMVRSSLMILLGFIILLLTLLVTVMVGGKFRQNLKELRSREGKVEGADISRGGVIGTAFMLGLNNMRRRKVRTGLTCGTLVLITFVMICFTSVTTNLVSIEQPTGRSVWNGIQIRDANFRSLDPAQVDATTQMYGNRYPITVRQWLAPVLNDPNQIQNAEIQIDHEFTEGGSTVAKRARVNSAIEMEWNEPQFTGLDRFLLTRKGWFPRPPSTREERISAARSGYRDSKRVILPDTVAKDLGIREQDVDNGSPVVQIRGESYVVQGIIRSDDLNKCIGPDGQSILPYDLNSVQTLGRASDGTAVVPPNVGRLNASQVILVNHLPKANPAYDTPITASCLVLLPKQPYRLLPNGAEYPAVDYKMQRRLVLGYLERTGQPAYYAIDGISYYGSRRRETTFAGLLELLVPILIAALTVFSTMRGSVYERKDEIYVYNAVGIAPNHVFFMFMAEACVYAVVGAVLGYILSQGTGRLLTMLNLTGGMNMDYSSIETIYASLAIMAAVLLSTILPARDAARLASPSETSGWSVPKADGDVLQLSLPFTFTAHDRLAVVSYFHRWFDANGAGSSGPFYCSPPEPDCQRRDKASDESEVVPVIACTVWLKPYDLGVSQRMEISLPTDPETGEFIARVTLTRLSGHAAGWNRALGPFFTALRKQFLNWRATTDAERGEMFGEARQLLTAQQRVEVRHG